LWEAFEEEVKRVHAAGAALTPDQVAKYEKEAKAALRQLNYADAADKAEFLNAA
jgi:hypothetical protein